MSLRCVCIHHIVIYIPTNSQGDAVTNDGESSKRIVPLVLPTQLESDESDSDDDETYGNKTLPNEYNNTDEDVEREEESEPPGIDETTIGMDNLKENERKKVCPVQ